MATKESTKSRESKADGEQDRNRGDSREEVERYRQAAEDALQQLDWCIGYLHGIEKVEIAEGLSRNRTIIRTRIMGVSEQSLPASQTNET
jgi:hypothetical protein